MKKVSLIIASVAMMMLAIVSTNVIGQTATPAKQTASTDSTKSKAAAGNKTEKKSTTNKTAAKSTSKESSKTAKPAGKN